MSHISEPALIVLSAVITFVVFVALGTAVETLSRLVAIYRHRRAVRKSAFRIASWPRPQERAHRRAR